MRVSKALAAAGAVLPLMLAVFGPAAVAQGQAQPQAPAPVVVIQSADAVEPEKAAVEELRACLEKITGRPPTLQNEAAPLNGSAAIYVGRTAFARKAGLDGNAFGEEEYALRTVGPNLIICGGMPNGTWNGVQHFLQRVLGCRFFRWDCEVIPQVERLVLPKLDVRRTPTFSSRHLYMAWRDFTPEGRKKLASFCRRNFMNPESSSYDRVSQSCRYATECHNEFIWVEPRKYAVSNPEFFTNKGKFSVDPATITGPNQEGSLCWTNHQVWDLTLARLREIIKADREQLPQWQWPRLYQFFQNDNTRYCACPNCEAVFKAEGSRAGALLQYVNYVAEEIAKEYPDVKLMTAAYGQTEFLPRTIRPAPNVLIRWCDLYSRSDCYRPLTGEVNSGQKGRFDAWTKAGAKVAVWDYWNMGMDGPYFDPPRVETMVDAIAPDFRTFAASGVDSLFIEAEFCSHTPQNFCELQHYVGLQLAADASLSEETLIKEYLAGCYGPAAPAMEEFLTLLRQAVKDVKQPLFYIDNRVRPYADGVFLARVYRLLKTAEAAVPPGSDYQRRVRQEMITPLAVILRNRQYDWRQLLGRTREQLLAEYRDVRLGRFSQPYMDPARRDAETNCFADEALGLAVEVPTPERFAGFKTIRKFAWPDMVASTHYRVYREPDPGSAVGKALVARGTLDRQDAQHDLSTPFAGGLFPNSWGIYSPYDKCSAEGIRTEVPPDEQYHWYKIKTWGFHPGSFLWGFYWTMQVDLSSAYSSADALPGANAWETWFSVKYTGPAYVKGSTRKNAVYLDQVILVKPENAAK